MAHGYNCGCAACCDEEEAQERRDEAIEADTDELIGKWMRDPEAIRDCLLDTNDEGRESILNACERFFADVEAAEGDGANAYIAAAAVALWKSLRPFVYAGLEGNAKDDATRAYERAERASA